jgi:hydrogenase expression/formation protein HypC
MCLAIPGKLERIEVDASGVATGRVSFGGLTRPVCLAYLPEAKVGDYVVVHVGFALSIIAESEAREVFRILHEMSEFEELESDWLSVSEDAATAGGEPSKHAAAATPPPTP